MTDMLTTEAQMLLDLAPRFWHRVNVVRSTKECWTWQGSTRGYGHGSFQSIAGHTAHRTAWALHHLQLPPDGMVVRHTCDNPPCCNPHHLLIGTQADNVRDMVERGRAGYSLTRCRRGHEMTDETTIIKTNGTRRCMLCARSYDAGRRASDPQLHCLRCDYSAAVSDLRKHMRRRHDLLMTVDEIRAAQTEVAA